MPTRGDETCFMASQNSVWSCGVPVARRAAVVGDAVGRRAAEEHDALHAVLAQPVALPVQHSRVVATIWRVTFLVSETTTAHLKSNHSYRIPAEDGGTDRKRMTGSADG